MVPINMFTNDALFEKSVRFANLVDDALMRADAKRSMTILRGSDDLTRTREQVAADFRKASNLELLDNHILERVKEVMGEAARREMTAVRRLFSEQAIYAIEVLGSVSQKSFYEITNILHPQPQIRQEVLAFRPRS